LNPHALRHMALNHACLPIPAPAQKQWYYNLLYGYVKSGTKENASSCTQQNVE